MKRKIALALTVLLLFTLTACETGGKAINIERPGEGTGQVSSFSAQYIRTDGYHGDVIYPVITVIHSVEELNAYYNANKDRYYLERRDQVYADSSIGFLDACDKYDAAYFEDQILILVLLQEGSGSIQHKVDDAKMYAEGKLSVSIRSIVPEVGTDDMAQWHIFIEPEVGVSVAKDEDVVVYLNGTKFAPQPRIIQEAGDHFNISIAIPHNWQYEILKGENNADYCIAFWPKGETEGKLKLLYTDFFGICGTDLKTEDITIGNYAAYTCTYGNAWLWEFIIFYDTPGTYVVLNEGAEKWWSRYGEEAMEILATVKLAEGINVEE